MFNFDNKLYHISIVGTAAQNDGNPTSISLLEYNPATGLNKELFNRELLIGGGYHTKNHYFNSIKNISINKSKKTISWNQYSDLTKEVLHINYNVETGESSASGSPVALNSNIGNFLLDYKVTDENKDLCTGVIHPIHGSGISSIKR